MGDNATEVHVYTYESQAGSFERKAALGRFASRRRTTQETHGALSMQEFDFSTDAIHCFDLATRR